MGTCSVLKARKSARIKAVDMKLNYGIMDSLVDSFVYFDKKIDIDFTDTLNKHFKEALKDNTFPDLLNKSNEALNR